MNDNFLEKYLRTYRPSGYEREAAELFCGSVTGNIEGARTEFIDNMWNACVSIGSDDRNARRVLISGHSDQNCLMVSDITKDGFIRFVTQGGISPKTIIDADMRIITDDGDTVPCFCSYKAIHLEKNDERKKCPENRDLVIDLGMSCLDDVTKLGIHIGSLIVFDNSRLDTHFGKSGEYIVGPGLDDGIAVTTVYDILESLDTGKLKTHNIRVYGAAMSSEETGARGAGRVVRKVNPDISIDIDVCHDCVKEIGCGDCGDTHMGKGVVICYGPEKNRTLTDSLRKCAVKSNTEHQLLAGKCGGTDTNNIQMMSDDCATALLGIPCRYMHSSSHEMVSRNDMESCRKLITEYINNGCGHE